MLGAIVLAVVIVFVIPIAFLMSTTVAAAALGESLRNDGEERNAGSELIELNK